MRESHEKKKRQKRHNNKSILILYNIGTKGIGRRERGKDHYDEEEEEAEKGGIVD